MPWLVYLAAAQENILSIVDYIASESGSADIAERFIGRLRQQCAKLAGLPGTLGRPRPELRSDVRSFPFRGYVIFFRYVDDVFQVVAILEGHRDIEAYFGTDEG